MPSLSDLAACFAALRAHYGCATTGASACGQGQGRAILNAAPASTASAFERALSVLLGFDKADECIAALRRLGGIESGLAAKECAVADASLPARLLDLSPAALEAAIRPAGNSRLKLPRLRGFLEFLVHRGEEGDDLFAAPEPFFLPGASAAELHALADSEDLRGSLALVRGISLETADQVLLFAFDYQVFPGSGQAWRFLQRHGFIAEDADYLEMQELLQAALQLDFEALTDSGAGQPDSGAALADSGAADFGAADSGAVAAGAANLPELALARHYKESWFLLRQLCSEFCRASKFLCDACPLRSYMEYQPCE
ncbi:hypothetical protein LJC48_03880 [Desulfovibrio sp. OttesenSCG-928-C06]|nr:hypothetical protein [Desulfovibrio sp. OttesenSCG-928-C06]